MHCAPQLFVRCKEPVNADSQGHAVTEGGVGGDAFWTQVRLNVTTWLILSAVAGIGYLGYTVPRMLEQVLKAQEWHSKQLVELATQLRTHEIRITRIEEQIK